MDEKWAMIDIETLGTGDMPVILSIGIILFNPWEDYRNIDIKDLNTLYLKPSIESSIAIDCEIDDDTLTWWSTQDEEIINEAFSEEGREDIQEVMKKLYKFSRNCDFYWAHGAVFDYNILEHVAKKLQRGVPWRYWQVRDTRSLFGLVDAKLPEAARHNALYDSYRQVIGLQNVFRLLKIVNYS